MPDDSAECRLIMSKLEDIQCENRERRNEIREELNLIHKSIRDLEHINAEREAQMKIARGIGQAGLVSLSAFLLWLVEHFIYPTLKRAFNWE
jgi:hypothetical protein